MNFFTIPLRSVLTLLVLFLVQYPLAQTQLGNTAWDSGLDFFGNPAFRAQQQGDAFGIETSIPGYSDQYFAAVNTWDNFGLGFRYFNDPYQSGRDVQSYQTSLQYSEVLFSGFTLGLRSNFYKGNFYAQDQLNWDWGFRWSPLGLLSIGFHQNGISNWIGESQPETQYGLWIQPIENFLSGGISWRQSQIEVPISGSKIARRFDLDSADMQVNLNLGAIQLGMNSPIAQSKDYKDWNYHVMVQNDFSTFGWSQRLENNAQTISLTDYKFKTRQQMFNYGVKILKLSGNISDEPKRFSVLGETSGTTTYSILQTLESISNQPIEQELIVKIEGLAINWANAREIRQALIEVQSKGTQVTAFVENPNLKSYYIASMANQVVVHPAAYVKLLGFSSEVPFYKGLFDTLNVQAQFIRHGKYKSAIEPYIRDSISPEAQRDIETMQSSLWKTLSEDIQVARKISADSLNLYLDSAHMNNHKAIEYGLIDTVMYFDQLFEDKRAEYISPKEFNYQQNLLSPIKKIAVIRAEGSIISGYSGTNTLTGAKYIGHKTIDQQLWAAANNPDISGVILRVNSPGGSAWASDEMHRSVERFKETGKPIIASVGGVAASGGYYLIMGTDKIFTEKTSILGSIGIFGGKFVVKGLYEKFGINHSTVKSHKSADAESMLRPWTDYEVKQIQGHMDDFYRTFVSKAAQGRGLDTNTVDSLGQGRVFTGAEALAYGLADEEGGLQQSIRYMIGQLDSPYYHEKFRILNISPEDSSWMDMAQPLIFWQNQMEKSKLPIKDFLNTLETQTIWAYQPYLGAF